MRVRVRRLLEFAVVDHQPWRGVLTASTGGTVETAQPAVGHSAALAEIGDVAVGPGSPGSSGHGAASLASARGPAASELVLGLVLHPAACR